MAGSLYIWFMLAFFLATAGVVLALMVMLRIGHWAERGQTGAKHGFLELPTELRQAPAAPEAGGSVEAPKPPADGAA